MATQTDFKKTAIIELASKGKIKELKNIAVEGVNQINARDAKDNTALIVAASKGHLEVVTWLINNNADINLANRKKETALMKSIEGNFVTITEQLLTYGADVNRRNIDGDTPLILAAKNGHVDIVRSLIQDGADIDARDNEGNNALLIAIKNNQIDIIPLLLEAGINVNSANTYLDTALILAIMAPSALTILDLLLKYGADLNIKNRYNRTPLWMACRQGNMEVVLYLIEKGSNIHDLDSKGSNLLYVASDNEPINVLEYLLSLKKLDINNQNNEGLTPLMVAALGGRADKVKMLVQSGANINLKDNDGETAFSLAKGYYPSIANYLKEQNK